MKTSRGFSHNSSYKLHQREIILIRRLWFEGWSDYRIWKAYRIAIPVIQKAKEEFEDKEMQAFELAKFKERLNFIIDNMGAIAKDPNVSHADRIKSEAVKLDALAMLHNATEASIASSDPQSALEKIIERTSSCATNNKC